MKSTISFLLALLSFSLSGQEISMGLHLQKDGAKLKVSRIKKEVKAIAKRGVKEVVLFNDMQYRSAEDLHQCLTELEDEFEGDVQFKLGLINTSAASNETIYSWWNAFYKNENPMCREISIIPTLDYNGPEYLWRSLMDSIIKIPRAKGIQNEILVSFNMGYSEHSIERLDQEVTYLFWPKDSVSFLKMKQWANLRKVKVAWMNSEEEWLDALHEKGSSSLVLMSWNGIWPLKGRKINWKSNLEAN